MALNGLAREGGNLADLLIAEPFGHQAKDLELQFGQAESLAELRDSHLARSRLAIRGLFQGEVREVRRMNNFPGMGLPDDVDEFSAIGILQNVTDGAGASGGAPHRA